MTTYAFPADKAAIHEKPLAANVEDAVTFAGRYDDTVTLIIHPSATTTPVYATADGSDPSPANGMAAVAWPGYAITLGNPRGVTQLRILSTAAATYSIEA